MRFGVWARNTRKKGRMEQSSLLLQDRITQPRLLLEGVTKRFRQGRRVGTALAGGKCRWGEAGGGAGGGWGGVGGVGVGGVWGDGGGRSLGGNGPAGGLGENGAVSGAISSAGRAIRGAGCVDAPELSDVAARSLAGDECEH